MTGDEARRVLFSLAQLTHRLNLSLREVCRDLTGLTVEQCLVLCLLEENGEITVSGLAAGATRANHTMSVAIDKLERKGLVRRRREGSQDRRKVFISLTDEGAVKARSFRDAAPGLVASLVADLGHEWLRDTRSLMATLASNLEPDGGLTGPAT